MSFCLAIFSPSQAHIGRGEHTYIPHLHFPHLSALPGRLEVTGRISCSHPISEGACGFTLSSNLSMAFVSQGANVRHTNRRSVFPDELILGSTHPGSSPLSLHVWIMSPVSFHSSSFQSLLFWRTLTSSQSQTLLYTSATIPQTSSHPTE